MAARLSCDDALWKTVRAASGLGKARERELTLHPRCRLVLTWSRLLTYGATCTAGCHEVRPLLSIGRNKMAAKGDSYTGEAYCVKCKAKREFTGRVEETNNRLMAKGICPVCGTRVNRILGKAK